MEVANEANGQVAVLVSRHGMLLRLIQCGIILLAGHVDIYSAPRAILQMTRVGLHDFLEAGGGDMLNPGPSCRTGM